LSTLIARDLVPNHWTKSSSDSGNCYQFIMKLPNILKTAEIQHVETGGHIKQHLRIKKFLGTSENAVKTQIWCAIATYVLIAIVKKELQLKSSLYTCLQILSVSVFEKPQVSYALQADDLQNEPPPVSNQLILFDF